MASQQKLRSHTAWRKFGGVPVIRRGASVFVYSPSSASRPDTSFGAPSMHPCTLDDPLEQQKTRVCWNDVRAVWESNSSYQPAGDELLIRFEVLTNAPMQGRCYGVFYSPSKNAYIAALRADVSQFIADSFDEATRIRVEQRAALVLPVETPEELDQLKEVEASVERFEAQIEKVQRQLLREVPVYIQNRLQAEISRAPHKEWYDDEDQLHKAESVSAYQTRVERFIKFSLENNIDIPVKKQEDILKLLEEYKKLLRRRDLALEQMDKVTRARAPLVSARGQRDTALLRKQKLLELEKRRAHLFDAGYELMAPVRPGQERSSVFPQPGQASRALPVLRPALLPAAFTPVGPRPQLSPEDQIKAKADVETRREQAVTAEKKLRSLEEQERRQRAQESAAARASSFAPERPVPLTSLVLKERDELLVRELELMYNVKRSRSLTSNELKELRVDLLRRYRTNATVREQHLLWKQRRENVVREERFWHPETLDGVRGLRGMTQLTGRRRLWER